jgi:hypothetical protein
LKTILILILTLTITSAATADELSREQQQQIIERYMYVTGQRTDRPAALEAGEMPSGPDKCGTPAILDFTQNRDRLDRDLMAALGVDADADRPVLQESHGVPGGYTLIHYNTTGDSAVWRAGIDNDHDGVPDYVEALALIADSCYIHMVDSLGYAPPLTDSICDDGGDGRIDIYLINEMPGLYGLTHNQWECSDALEYQHEASWIIIENDFQSLPNYVDRPLDAARVTIAHELFHVFHFSIDATEHASWFEMSAVWMEEEIYDNINDYYLHDSLYFSTPWLGLQDISFHMYQSAVFPIYLSERYDPGVIRAVWERSGALGLGPDYLMAIDDVLDSVSRTPAYAQYECLCYNADSTGCLESSLIVEDLASAFAEFAVWNFFTGPYADQAPNGIGYSEAEHYASIPIDSMVICNTYPISVGPNDNYFEPQPNGAVYMRMENLQSIDLDTLFDMFVKPDPNAIVRWGVSGIFQMEDNPDSHVVVTDVVDAWETWVCYEMEGDSCVDLRLNPGRYVADMLGEYVCTDGEFGYNSPYCDSSTCLDSVGIIDLRLYRSFTLVMTPTSLSTGPYIWGTGPDTSRVEINYAVLDSSFIDVATVDLRPNLLTPYPNPAVVSSMDGANLMFRLQAATDSVGFPESTQTTLVLKVYTVAGELVQTIQETQESHNRGGPRQGGVFEIAWDMKNQSGVDVASGAYLAVVRMYQGAKANQLLVIGQTKVAVIR